MSDSQNSSRHVSYEQVKTIIDFMAQHADFAVGGLRSLEARHASKALWIELASSLNNVRSGTKKTSDGWSRYWSDFKNKLKNKVSILKKKKRSSSSAKKNIKPLSRLEKRALVILGPYLEQKICKQNYSPPEVKLETYYENGHSNYSNTFSESSERQSDESNDHESSEDFDNNIDDDASEPIIQSIYPKWLIEIEKTRADADLIRAKAEEQRANIAAKNSDAALIQAEALKKLADAAVIQAEALAKIAVLIENGAQREISMPV